MSKYIWLFDPGHGGLIEGIYQTRGKRSPVLPDGRILYEGEFNRSIVSRLSDLCSKNDIEFVNLVYTNLDLPLSKRVNKANRIHKQDKRGIYVSIHANGFGNGKNFNSAHGISTFYHVSSKKGAKIAKLFQKNLVKHTHLRDRGAIGNSRWANFYVLRKTNMPAILTENGFMTNLKEAKLLLSSEFRDKIAQAHFQTILEIENNDLY